MKYNRLKYAFSNVGIAIAMASLLQACQDGYDTANISTISASLMSTSEATMGKKETPVNPGVQRSLEEYITDHTSYPPAAMINRVEGTVYVQFSIEDNGTLSDVSVIGKRIGYGLEEEAIRVVNEMPEWIAIEIKGNRSKRILPIVYRIRGEENNLKI
jgi:TonB family protein